ncbi:MAG: hypothetical protein N4A76_04440 [Firmicutes bacterium]|jgi:hypothetical protein|nr:hypothetical protein [Bacillota bacterium]
MGRCSIYGLKQTNLLGYDLVGVIDNIKNNSGEITLTNFDLNKNSELLIRVELVNSLPNPSGLHLYYEDVYSDSSYCAQLIQSESSKIVAFRYQKPVICSISSQKKNIIDIIIKITNSGEVVAICETVRDCGDVIRGVEKYYITSTFKLSKLNKVVLRSTLSNIGNGSNIRIYKRMSPTVAEVIVEKDASKVIIDNLSINNLSDYVLISDWKYNGTDSNAQLFMYINDNYINSKYFSQRYYAENRNVQSLRYNFPLISVCDKSKSTFSYCTLNLMNNGLLNYYSKSIRNYGNQDMYLYNMYGHSIFSTNEITKLTISSSRENGIKAGSRFQLIKLK